MPLTAVPHHDPWADRAEREARGYRAPWCNAHEERWHRAAFKLKTGDQLKDLYGDGMITITPSIMIAAGQALGEPVRFHLRDGSRVDGVVICSSLNTYGLGVVAYDLLDRTVINHADVLDAEPAPRT